MWSAVYAELLFTCTELYSRKRTDGFKFVELYKAHVCHHGTACSEIGKKEKKKKLKDKST